MKILPSWGGFSSYAAKNYKSKIEAITISKSQFEYASKKIQKEGLGEKVSIKFKDYRDIDSQYSNIASIEMFEASNISIDAIFEYCESMSL